MSEKRDLWVPVALALGGAGILTWHIVDEAGSLWAGLAALVIGLVGAIVCLPLRMRRGQARVVAFGLGTAMLMAVFVPALSPSGIHVFAWIVGALAFLLPIRTASVQVRAVMLSAAGVFALLAVLSVIDVLDVRLTWLFIAGAFFFAAQVWSSRVVPEPEIPPGPRICVFGGTFDPFHIAHRALAEAALKVNDRLLVVPAGSAPHKFLGDAGAVPDRTPFHHRVAMVRLGVEGLPRTEVLEMEGKRAGPSYTVDTLEALRGAHGLGTRWRLLVGADMLQDFPNWREWERIVEDTALLVAARPGHSIETPEAFEGREIEVIALEVAERDVSSTDVRTRLKSGKDVGGDLSPAIKAYIEEHGLYEPSE